MMDGTLVGLGEWINQTEIGFSLLWPFVIGILYPKAAAWVVSVFVCAAWWGV